MKECNRSSSIWEALPAVICCAPWRPINEELSARPAATMPIYRKSCWIGTGGRAPRMNSYVLLPTQPIHQANDNLSTDQRDACVPGHPPPAAVLSMACHRIRLRAPYSPWPPLNRVQSAADWQYLRTQWTQAYQP